MDDRSRLRRAMLAHEAALTDLDVVDPGTGFPSVAERRTEGFFAARDPEDTLVAEVSGRLAGSCGGEGLMSARIVVPTVRDAEQLGRLHHLVRREMCRQVGADAPESTVQDVVTGWQERLQHVDSAGCDERGCTLRAALGRERLVGFVVAGPGRDPGWEAMGELWALSVHPDWRGTGVADALVGAALPAGLVYLWVLQGNGRAIAFYRRLGFTADGADRVDESTGATELRMLRSAGTATPAPAPRP